MLSNRAASLALSDGRLFVSAVRTQLRTQILSSAPLTQSRPIRTTVQSVALRTTRIVLSGPAGGAGPQGPAGNQEVFVTEVAGDLTVGDLPAGLNQESPAIIFNEQAGQLVDLYYWKPV